jgi:xanthine dehydrogenase large subunit
MFVIESAIAHAAEKLGVSAAEIQRRNLLETGDEFPYGQIAESEAVTSWSQAMPICFGISFTKTPMNQARSLVHVYTDGSVAVSTGAVEMGQGVNTKMAQVAARVFGLDIGDIRVHTTNTLRIANTSPTAASAASDLNGKATQIACETIRKRLLEVAASMLCNGGSPSPCKPK